ncbi:MAG: ABC transporter ATP-binding protein [Pseudomonadota bacterium]
MAEVKTDDDARKRKSLFHIEPGTSLDLIRRLFRETFRAHLPTYLMAVVSMAIVAGCTVALAYLIRHVVNDAFITQNLTSVWMLAGVIVVLSVSKGFADYAQRVFLGRIGNAVVAKFQNRIFEKMMAFGLPYYDKTHSSRLVTAMTNYTRAARNIIILLSTSLGRDLFTVIGLCGVMIFQDPLLAGLAILFGMPALYGIGRIVKQMRDVSKLELEGMAAVIANTQETATGIRSVKSFTMEDQMAERFQEAVSNVQERANRVEAIKAQTSPLMEAMGGIVVAFLIIYAGQQATNGLTTPGEFVSFILAFLLAYEPAKRLSRLHVALQRDLVAGQRLYTLLDRMEQEPLADTMPDLPPVKGRVVLQDVTFDYRKDAPVLRAVNIEAQPGEVVALVGASGAGKSTVVGLIQRLFEARSGKILIDGTDIATVNLRNLRSQIAVVSQDTVMFRGTIRENIRLGRPTASDEEIEEVARQANAEAFILETENGFDTQIGERGANLSGGQAQRISIARALLKGAPILLLDEATSALDNNTEQQVRDALIGLMKGRTTIVVAHRLSTIVGADRIYVLENGQVTGQGNHKSLLKDNAAYKRLFGSITRAYSEAKKV